MISVYIQIFTFPYGICVLITDHRLENYKRDRNKPNDDVLSNMSPYLHFGQIGAQAMALHVRRANKHHENADVFIEQSVVRRELCDNFCFCKCVSLFKCFL